MNEYPLPASITSSFNDLGISWSEENGVLTLSTNPPLSVRRGVKLICDAFPRAAAIRVTREKATIQLS